jgi:hypothetical protein
VLEDELVVVVELELLEVIDELEELVVVVEE